VKGWEKKGDDARTTMERREKKGRRTDPLERVRKRVSRLQMGAVGAREGGDPSTPPERKGEMGTCRLFCVNPRGGLPRGKEGRRACGGRNPLSGGSSLKTTAAGGKKKEGKESDPGKVGKARTSRCRKDYKGKGLGGPIGVNRGKKWHL